MNSIGVRNLVSSRTGEGLVEVLFDDNPVGQMTVQEARQYAQQLQECAAVAETEASLCTFLRETAGLEAHVVAGMLAEFRASRKGADASQGAGPEEEADASLIAAAPDLLAACIAVEHNLRQGAVVYEDVNLLRAAIAKARG